MGAFRRRRSTNCESSSTTSTSIIKNNKNNNHKRRSSINTRQICFPDDDAGLVTIVCEIPCRADYSDHERAQLFFQKPDFGATRHAAKSCSRECEASGDSGWLQNSFSAKSKTIQEALNQWTVSSARHDCRGLERWSNRQHGDQRSEEQFSAIMAILQAQQDMINANVMRTSRQHTRRASLNSVTSRSTVGSTASTDIDDESLRKVATKVTRSARHFARMMGKADSHAVAMELKADLEFQRQYSYIWNGGKPPPKQNGSNNDNSNNQESKQAETTTIITTSNIDTDNESNNNSSTRLQLPGKLNHMLLNRNEDDVSLVSDASSVAESEISNTDIARLSSGVSLLSMDSEFELESNGGEDDLLLGVGGGSGTSASSLLLSSNQNDPEEDEEDEDFLPQVDECQEASKKAKKSKNKKLRLIKKLKRRINTKKDGEEVVSTTTDAAGSSSGKASSSSSSSTTTGRRKSHRRASAV